MSTSLASTIYLGNLYFILSYKTLPITCIRGSTSKLTVSQAVGRGIRSPSANLRDFHNQDSAITYWASQLFGAILGTITTRFLHLLDHPINNCGKPTFTNKAQQQINSHLYCLDETLPTHDSVSTWISLHSSLCVDTDDTLERKKNNVTLNSISG